MRISILTYFLLISLSNAVTKHCHGDRCFWLSDTTQGTQSQGRTACQSEGGDLAVMETEELYNFVASNLRLVICTTNILRGCFARQITRELINLILKKYYFLWFSSFLFNPEKVLESSNTVYMLKMSKIDQEDLKTLLLKYLSTELLKCDYTLDLLTHLTLKKWMSKKQDWTLKFSACKYKLWKIGKVSSKYVMSPICISRAVSKTDNIGVFPKFFSLNDKKCMIFKGLESATQPPLV